MLLGLPYMDIVDCEEDILAGFVRGARRRFMAMMGGRRV
jgi:hypothetical protein